MKNATWLLALVPSLFAFTTSNYVLAQSLQTESIVEARELNGETVASERDEQADLFNYYFRDRELRFETRFDKLETEASVPSWRVPYSADIHPETSGGLSSRGGRQVRRVGLFGRQRQVTLPGGGSSALTLYDQAFNDGRELANGYELKRITTTSRGLFGFIRSRSNSESWEGYCSGFTASTIRHPEPIRAVDAAEVGGAAGITFQPADIKALLTCIYNRTTSDSFLFLAPPSARDGGPNMGTFHLALANYIGQAGHPIGMDRTKGQVAWNNPGYAYKVTSITDAGQVNDTQIKRVQTTVTFSDYGSDSQRQTDLPTGNRVRQRQRTMKFVYLLALDDKGHVVGGRALSGSGHFLWLPLYAPQATTDGSIQGNPYVNVRHVIALARAAALSDVQEKFDTATVGPAVDPNLETSPDPNEGTASDSE